MSNLIENTILAVDCPLTITDWGILNSISPIRLRRMLTKHPAYKPAEIQAACELISAYHQVYRRDLIQLRCRKYFGQCPPPTFEQLQRIAHLQNKNNNTTPQQILVELQNLAQLLR